MLHDEHRLLSVAQECGVNEVFKFVAGEYVFQVFGVELAPRQVCVPLHFPVSTVVHEVADHLQGVEGAV